MKFCKQKGIIYQVFGVFWAHNEWLLGCKLVRELVEQGITVHQALIRALVDGSKTIGLRAYIVSGTTSKTHMEESAAALELELNSEPTSVAAFPRLLGWDGI